MPYDELNELLTENEKQIYITLLRLGESTASPILEKTGLQNSVFYRTIHRLMEKGLVSYILKGKIKHFIASNPSVLARMAKDKAEKISKVLPELANMQKISEIKTSAEVFVGVKGVLALYYSLIEDAKPNEDYYYFGPNLEVFKTAMEKVYMPFRAYRLEKKIKVYGLQKTELRGKIVKFKNTEERYTNFPLPPNMAIFRDRIVMASWGDIPTGILIKDEKMAKQYRELFKQIWKLAKP
jgi:sugar-specific transcriptional regulator TrmB